MIDMSGALGVDGLSSCSYSWRRYPRATLQFIGGPDLFQKMETLVFRSAEPRYRSSSRRAVSWKAVNQSTCSVRLKATPRSSRWFQKELLSPNNRLCCD